MNIVLFNEEELDRPLAKDDARALHVLNVIGCRQGDSFDVGLIDGPRGKARIEAATHRGLELDFHFSETVPRLYPVTMIIGPPHPQRPDDAGSRYAALRRHRQRRKILSEKPAVDGWGIRASIARRRRASLLHPPARSRHTRIPDGVYRATRRCHRPTRPRQLRSRHAPGHFPTEPRTLRISHRLRTRLVDRRTQFITQKQLRISEHRRSRTQNRNRVHRRFDADLAQDVHILIRPLRVIDNQPYAAAS